MGIVDIALSQEGTREKNVNEVQYNEWYYGRNVIGGEYPWCAVFISWCANQANIPTTVIPKTASVTKMYEFFLKANLFQPKGNGYRPKSGDIMIQKSGGVSHTGIVYDSDASKFYTIEGNTDNGVYRREYKYDDNKLTGFGTPNYPVETVKDEDGSEFMVYTVKAGDTLQGIARTFGLSTKSLGFLNGLTSSIVSIGQKIQIPKINVGTKQLMSGLVSKVTDSEDTGITQSHTTNFLVSHPTIEVEFYCETGKLAAVSTTGLTSDTDVDNEIISVSTMRDMGQDCPTFTITMVWRNNWFFNLSSNDLIIIRMQRPPEAKRTVFYGLIDDIRKTIDFSSGKPQRAVQVTGRGFNKAFVSFDVGTINKLFAKLGFFKDFNLLSGCDSYRAIEIVQKSYVGRAIRYEFGNGLKYEDYYQYKGNNHGSENLIDYMSYSRYNGSLWNFIKELSNSPFNETYWEVEDDKPTLIHRKTPFNKEDWLSIPRTTILDSEMVTNATGRSDLETYTVFSVQQSKMNETLQNSFPPLWYQPYYEKYGISQIQVTTPYSIYGKNDGGAHKEFCTDLYNFNIKNNVFENGNITVMGKAAYAVGERIILESNNMEYYIESVSHSFNCYGTWTTTLGVTRGIEPENRFTSPWGEAKELTPNVAAAMFFQTGGEEIDWDNLPDYAGKLGGLAGPAGGGGIGAWGNGAYTWPVPGWTQITSPFGPREAPTPGASTFHSGIDIGADLGSPIVAAYPGTVISSGPASGYGNWIRIDHGNGEITIYGHMRVLQVSEGETVSAGQQIALVGCEGFSTGPHLHFQVEVNGEAVNPEPFFTRKTYVGVGTNGTAEENRDACYQYMTQKFGFNKALACAILGNINNESGFKLESVGDGGTSRGLIQWHNERESNLIQFCQSNGYDVYSIEGQMEFMNWEFHNTESYAFETFRYTPDTVEGARDGAGKFCIHYERPYAAQSEALSRGQAAVNFYTSVY